MSLISLQHLRQAPPLELASGLIALASAGSLLTAFGFEYIGGYAPCPLCLIERIAYYGAVPAGALAFIFARQGKASAARGLLVLCVLGFLINAGIGIYHSGVEWKWWPGPDTCSQAAAGNFDTSALLEGLEQGRVVRCDEAPWRMFGLSFAGWSAVISAWLAAIGMCGIRADAQAR